MSFIHEFIHKNTNSEQYRGKKADPGVRIEWVQILPHLCDLLSGCSKCTYALVPYPQRIISNNNNRKYLIGTLYKVIKYKVLRIAPGSQ